MDRRIEIKLSSEDFAILVEDLGAAIDRLDTSLAHEDGIEVWRIVDPESYAERCDDRTSRKALRERLFEAAAQLRKPAASGPQTEGD